MRYRRVTVRYATFTPAGQTWPFADLWQTDRLRLLVQPRWRPDTDTYETASTVEILVDLAGIEDDDVEVQLFDDVVVIEGRRQLSPGHEVVRYHAAAIRQGGFRVDVPLPVPVDLEGVDARYERGLLRITVPKARAAR